MVEYREWKVQIELDPRRDGYTSARPDEVLSWLAHMEVRALRECLCDVRMSADKKVTLTLAVLKALGTLELDFIVRQIRESIRSEFKRCPDCGGKLIAYPNEPEIKYCETRCKDQGAAEAS